MVSGRQQKEGVWGSYKHTENKTQKVCDPPTSTLPAAEKTLDYKRSCQPDIQIHHLQNIQ